MNGSLPVILLMTFLGTKIGSGNALKDIDLLSKVVSIEGASNNQSVIFECLSTFQDRPYFKEMILNLSKCIISSENEPISYEMSRETFLNTIDAYYRCFTIWKESEPVFFGEMDKSTPINLKWIKNIHVLRNFLYSEGIFFTGNLLRIPNIVYSDVLQQEMGLSNLSRDEFCRQSRWVITVIARFNAYQNDDLIENKWFSPDCTIDNLMAHYSPEAQRGLIDIKGGTKILGGQKVGYITEALSIKTFYSWDSLIGSNILFDNYKSLSTLDRDIKGFLGPIFDDMSKTKKTIPDFMPPRELHLIFDLLGYRSNAGDMKRNFQAAPIGLWS